MMNSRVRRMHLTTVTRPEADLHWTLTMRSFRSILPSGVRLAQPRILA
jgi:hypothetical protein